jgi:tetratricopeptide (TPR) repeat protein
LNLCDDRGEYYNLLATFHLKRSEFSLAEQHLLEALKHKPDDKALYKNGVRIYEQLGKREKEITFLKEVLKRDPDDVSSAFRLGTIYLGEKSYSEAADLLQKVIEKDPSHSGALINFGIIAKRTGDLDGASTYLERALQESPNSVEALSNLGYVYYDKDDVLGAKEIFERLNETDPTLMDIHLMLCVIYIRLEHFEQVVTECDKMLDLLGLDRNIMLNSLSDLGNLFIDIGKALCERSEPAVATLAFNVFVHLSGETSESLKKVGSICFQQGCYDASLEFLEKAIRLNPQDCEAFRFMGDCYVNMGIEEAAAMSYQKANELNTAAISCNKAPWNNDSPLSQY